MFTGLVERTARVLSITERGSDTAEPNFVRLEVAARAEAAASGDVEPYSGLAVGESIAVSGVCLTLVEFDAERLAFDVVPETLRVTTLERLEVGDAVNLERALRVGDRLGGHYVTGHVDARGRVAGLTGGEEETLVEVEIVDTVDRFATIPKGSVTVDGVSLTVVESEADRFSVALVPHTLAVTTLGHRAVGDLVNLEMDHVGKWVDRLLQLRGS